jgi:hypothetical protein
MTTQNTTEMPSATAVKEGARHGIIHTNTVYALPLKSCFLCGKGIDHCGERYVYITESAAPEVCDGCAVIHDFEEWPSWLPTVVTGIR